jgi:hypothetical protein
MAFLLGTAILRKNGDVGFPQAQSRSHPEWANAYAALPLNFEANRGQTDSRVDFLARGRGFALFLTGRDAVLTLKSNVSAGSKHPASVTPFGLELVGANSHPAVVSTDQLPGKANYFMGNDRSKWHTDIPTYAKVRYQAVYPGIDLVYYGAQGGQLEYDFVVAPGADPGKISLGLETQKPSTPRIDSDGAIVVSLPGGEVQLHKPVVYQESPNTPQPAKHRQWVPGHYVLDAANHIRFEVGPYDHNRPLIIDPVVAYATYLGGTGGDVGYAIAVDANFDAYVAGVTNSSDFPTFSPYQEYKGTGDAFITKMNAGGTKLIYSTYLGGSQTNAATAIAVSNGSAYVTGYTTSPDFPIQAAVSTANALQITYGGATDAFVTALSTLGNTLVYSTFLGGSGADYGMGIAADATGYAYVTGFTESTNFPLTTNARQPTINGTQDAFVAKVNQSGEALVFSTYLGGTAGLNAGQAITIDSTDDIFVTGYTYASDFLTANPPTTPAIYDRYSGGKDVFITEINSGFTGIPFSTFLGGSADDAGMGIALDSSNNIYVTGTTSSTNFPTTSGVIQTSLRGASNAFVTKLNAGGASVSYSTYLGGSGTDTGNAIAVTPGGAAFVTGSTNSSNFPTASPIQALLGLSTPNNFCGTNPCPDAFISSLNTGATALTYSTYLGGSGYDSGQGIAVDSNGDAYITGSTASTNLPAIYGDYKTSLTGTAGNAFIAKIDTAASPIPPNISIQPASVDFGNEAVNVTSTLQQITIVNPSTVPLEISSITIGLVGNSSTVFTIASDNCVSSAGAAGGGTGTLPGGSAYCTLEVAFTPNTTGSLSDEIYITDNVGGTPGTQQIINLTGFGNTSATAVTLNPTSLSFNTQAVGTTSAPQSVSITNTGTQELGISSISVGTSTDYNVTYPSCQALGMSLQVNQSCTVNVVFNPTATGTRSALLAFNDNAAGSPQTVSLTGTGSAAFSLSEVTNSSITVNPALVGDTQTTFQLEALGPSTFTSSIALNCPTNITCAFSTNPILVGQYTTMTVSNLTIPTGPTVGAPSTNNPLIFDVTGTSGSQTTSLQISLEFEDFTLTVTPSVNTVLAGDSANYTVIINPLFGFNQKVTLSCYQGLPSTVNCIFNPSATVTASPTGPTSVQLQMTTQKYVPTTTHTLPRLPPGPLPPLICGLLSLAGLASLALVKRRRAPKRWLAIRLAALSAILALNLTLAACRSSALVISGTTTGNYTITIAGVLTSNTAVLRSTTTVLAVTALPTSQ